MNTLNETHDPDLQSWVESANSASTDFPIQNLPFCAFRRKGSRERYCVGVGIGDLVLDVIAALPAFEGLAREAAVTCANESLNALMALSPAHWSALRLRLSRILRADYVDRAMLQECMVRQDSAEFIVPAKIGDFTDCLASLHHATKAARIVRPDNPLLPNFQWLPIAYHGRASSIRVSGHAVTRPHGQTKAASSEQPSFGPCKNLDFELELGLYIGGKSDMGTAIPIDEVDKHIFGLTLLNDWTARDMMVWEFQPLGPFLSKNFATTVSPWVVTLEALEPFRQTWFRAHETPAPLAYLDSALNRERGQINVELEVSLLTSKAAAQGLAPEVLSHSNLADAYWTIGQLATHHASNGCNLEAGDLIGTGTLSGPALTESGCLLEMNEGGRREIVLGNGERRTYLLDGDTVVMRARSDAPGYRSIGFGEVAGTVLPARR